jgi:hypothetical protein
MTSSTTVKNDWKLNNADYPPPQHPSRQTLNKQKKSMAAPGAKPRNSKHRTVDVEPQPKPQTLMRRGSSNFRDYSPKATAQRGAGIATYHLGGGSAGGITGLRDWWPGGGGDGDREGEPVLARRGVRSELGVHWVLSHQSTELLPVYTLWWPLWFKVV